MEPGMQAGDDPSLDGAVAAITAKLRGGALEEKPDKRENREDRDDLDRQGTNDLDESDRLARQSGDEDGESQQADAETEGAEKAEDDAEAFIELPPAEEGGEPQRIPLTEATEAVQKLRQMNGEIATAVIKAEEEAFTKQDQFTQAIAQTLTQVENHAKATLQMMNLFAPQTPHPDDFYTTEDYYKAKLHHEKYIEHYNQVLGTVKQAQDGKRVIVSQQDQEYARREADRINRVIPEFKDEKTREARKSEILDVLGKTYGVTKAELDEIIDHKAWRMMNDLAKLKSAEKKAPEVKKHLQEHKQAGTEESFARLLMRSGALKNL